MAFFGSTWKDDIEDDGPIVPSSWKDDSDDPNFIPEPSVEELLDRMSNEQRLKVFAKYCQGCGIKGGNCKCWP